MSQEKYIPSEEDAEGMMVPVEVTSTENREKLGVGGFLQRGRKDDMSDPEFHITGKIKGHEVHFIHDENPPYQDRPYYRAFIDGIEFDNQNNVAEKLWKKYEPMITNSAEITEKAEEERGDWQATILRDLLGE